MAFETVFIGKRFIVIMLWEMLINAQMYCYKACIGENQRLFLFYKSSFYLICLSFSSYSVERRKDMNEKEIDSYSNKDDG